MAEICVFCGKTIGLWKDRELLCGNELQISCEACWERYQQAPPIQRARLALDSGRAVNPDGVRQFLEAAERKAEKERQRRERQRESLLCCGQPMAREREDYTFVDQTPLRLLPPRTPSLYLFRCELCGQVKFFDARFFAEEQPEIEIPEPPGAPERERAVCQPGQKPPWEK